ncbi:hypothetical protein C8Q76DRAFT_795999 [Earliella scabrosa]|nr:hypothetical protein C8Q76DRAFT_795999 [Earliella scabrosa]
MSEYFGQVKTRNACSKQRTNSTRHEAPAKMQTSQRMMVYQSLSAAAGFQITKTAQLTQHEKKRRYLECLEFFVPWLEQTLRACGANYLPPLERLSEYRGLTVVSLRTLLILNYKLLNQLNKQKERAEMMLRVLQEAADMQMTSAAFFECLRHRVILRRFALKKAEMEAKLKTLQNAVSA